MAGQKRTRRDDLASTVDAEGRLEQRRYGLLFNARSCN